MTRQIRRPLLDRQMTGAMMGEDAILVRVEQQRNARGVTTSTVTREPVRVATTPLSPTDPRAALLTQGGTRIEDVREFFAPFKVSVKRRDQIIYPSEGGDTYTIVSAAEYSSHTVLIGQRDEQQS